MKNSCLLHFTFLAVSVSSVVYAQNMELNTRSFSIAQAKIDAQLEIARMNNEAKFGLQAAKDDSVHQLKAAEIIDRKMNPPPPPAPGKFPGSKK